MSQRSILIKKTQPAATFAGSAAVVVIVVGATPTSRLRDYKEGHQWL